jgi:hypothetical protein
MREAEMPTAVERLLDSFLKLNDRHEQGALNDAFLKIDDDLLKLSTASTDSFLKIEHEHSLKIDFDVIGDGFLKLGQDFHKIDTALGLIDNFVVKATDGAPGLGSDFALLDHKISAAAADLKILGSDFLKLDTSPDMDAFRLKIAGIADDFLKLGADMAANADAFHKLGDDFLRLAGGDKVSPLDLAYKEFGGDLKIVGDQFGVLAGDFLKLDQAMHGSGGGAGIVESGGGGGAGTVESAGGGGGAGVVGFALLTLYQDFHTLGAALGEMGDGSVRVISELSQQSFLTPGGHGEHG